MKYALPVVSCQTNIQHNSLQIILTSKICKKKKENHRKMVSRNGQYAKGYQKLAKVVSDALMNWKLVWEDDRTLWTLQCIQD